MQHPAFPSKKQEKHKRPKEIVEKGGFLKILTIFVVNLKTK